MRSRSSSNPSRSGINANTLPTNYQRKKVETLAGNSKGLKMKYVLVTGGVVSGLGKGVTASSIGVVLKACGLRVTSIKIGPVIAAFIVFLSYSFTNHPCLPCFLALTVKFLVLPRVLVDRSVMFVIFSYTF